MWIIIKICMFYKRKMIKLVYWTNIIFVRFLNVIVIAVIIFYKTKSSISCYPKYIERLSRSWTSDLQLLSTRTVMHVPIEDREKERTNVYSQWANCLLIIFNLFVLHDPIYETANAIPHANLILEFACRV